MGLNLGMQTFEFDGLSTGGDWVDGCAQDVLSAVAIELPAALQ